MASSVNFGSNHVNPPLDIETAQLVATVSAVALVVIFACLVASAPIGSTASIVHAHFEAASIALLALTVAIAMRHHINEKEQQTPLNQCELLQTGENEGAQSSQGSKLDDFTDKSIIYNNRPSSAPSIESYEARLKSMNPLFFDATDVFRSAILKPNEHQVIQDAERAEYYVDGKRRVLKPVDTDAVMGPDAVYVDTAVELNPGRTPEERFAMTQTFWADLFEIGMSVYQSDPLAIHFVDGKTATSWHVTENGDRVQGIKRFKISNENQEELASLKGDIFYDFANKTAFFQISPPDFIHREEFFFQKSGDFIHDITNLSPGSLVADASKSICEHLKPLFERDGRELQLVDGEEYNKENAKVLFLKIVSNGCPLFYIKVNVSSFETPLFSQKMFYYVFSAPVPAIVEKRAVDHSYVMTCDNIGEDFEAIDGD